MFEAIPGIRFADPVWLGLLASLPLMVWWGRKSIAGLPGFRSYAALAVRMLVVIALSMALARAQLVLVREDMAVAYAVDLSLSVPTDQQRKSLDYVGQSQASDTRQGGDKVAMVTFGRSAAIDQPFTQEKLDTSATRAVISSDHTNLAAAIRTAVAAMPQVGRKRIVLVTDGNENEGAAVSEAAAARAAGVRIDCLPVRYLYTHEVMLEKVAVPTEAETGRTVNVSVIVRAFNEGSGTLRLFANGVEIASEKVDLEQGVNAFVVTRTLPVSGVYDFKAIIESGDDNLYQNNAATAFSIVKGPRKVLLVEGKPADGRDLADALRNLKLTVDEILPGALPGALPLLTGYDAVILANVAASDIPAGMVKTLEGAVKEYGIGLVMVGGDNSFGAGGWKGTPVEEALPVSMDVKDRQVVPTGALVIINHTCEFQDGNRWGINISKAALDTLGRYDEFGVLCNGPRGEQWFVDLAPVEDRDKTKAMLETMQAGDMPSFDGTLNMAHEALTKSKASVKHVVIISDGDPQPPSLQLLEGITSDKMTVSTVAVFPHDGTATDTMEAIARVCKGRFYQPSSPTQLPQIFIKEAKTVRRGLIFEKPFVPSMVLPTEPVTGFQEGDFPQLLGYVISTIKPLAEMPLVTSSGDPLLAHWQYGLGRSVAFTSDAAAKWGAGWIPWDQYGRFWGQLVEWVQRKVETGDYAVNCRVSGETAAIAVDAIDRQGNFVNYLDFSATVLTPENQSRTIKFVQTGPGHYEGTFKADEVGTFVPIIQYKDSGGNLRSHTTAVTVPFSAEYKALSTNDLVLKEIAGITGGRVIEEATDVFRRDFPPDATYDDVWHWLAGAAAALFLLDVFLRRVIIDYARAAAKVRESLLVLMRLRPVPAQRPAYTSTLLAAKQAAAKERREAARKFESEDRTAAAPLDQIARDEALLRARARAEKAPEGVPPAKEVAGEPESTFDRLLEAKRRAIEERKKNQGRT